MRKIILLLLPLLLTGGMSPPKTTPGEGNRSARFVVLSDKHGSGGGTARAVNLARTIRNFHPDIVVDIGDLDTESASWEDSLDRFVDTLRTGNGDLIYAMTVGNHDGSLGSFPAVYTAADSADAGLRVRTKYPQVGSGAYSVRVGNCLFILLDTRTNAPGDSFRTNGKVLPMWGGSGGNSVPTAPPWRYFGTPDSFAWNFVAGELARTDVDWKFVFGHYGIYSITGDYSSGARVWGQFRSGGDPATWGDLIEGGTDVLFSGHQHCYAVIGPVRNDSLVAGGTQLTGCTTHIIAGMSGYDAAPASPDTCNSSKQDSCRTIRKIPGNWVQKYEHTDTPKAIFGETSGMIFRYALRDTSGGTLHSGTIDKRNGVGGL